MFFVFCSFLFFLLWEQEIGFKNYKQNNPYTPYLTLIGVGNFDLYDVLPYNELFMSLSVGELLKG